MKLTFKRFALAAAMAAVCVLTGFAQNFTVDNVKYKVLPEGGVEIADAKKATGDFVVPKTVSNNGREYTVKAIGKDAFKKAAITSVTIPETVLTIGNNAFKECPSLATATFISPAQETVSNAEPEIPMPAGLSEEDMRQLRELQASLSPSTTGKVNIEDGAFSNCSALREVNLPTNLNRIGSSAFERCGALESITLPEGLRIIEGKAFNYTPLKAVVIPKSVTQLESAFQVCPQLNNFVLADGPDPIEFEGVFSQYTPVKSLYIGRTVTKSAAWPCFTGSNQLSKIGIGYWVKELPEYIFRGCSGIRDVLYASRFLEYHRLKNELSDQTMQCEGPSDFKVAGGETCGFRANSFGGPGSGSYEVNKLHEKYEGRDAWSEYLKTRDLAVIDRAQSSFASANKPHAWTEVSDSILAYFGTLTEAELKADRKIRSMLREMQNDYLRVNDDREQSLECTRLNLIIDPEDAYTPALSVYNLVALGRLEQAAAAYPKALRLATANGVYAVPDELKNTGIYLNDRGFNLQLSLPNPNARTATAGGGADRAQVALELCSILNDAYQRHKAEKIQRQLESLLPPEDRVWYAR